MTPTNDLRKGTNVRRALVDTAHGQMMVRTSGVADPSTPAVLFIHQMQSSGRMWLDVMAGLGDVLCIAPDIPGLGDSDFPADALDLEGYAEAVFDAARPFIPAAGCVVVGHHAGAVYAAQLATVHEDVVKGALLIGYVLHEDWRKAHLGFYDIGLEPIGMDGSGVMASWNRITKNLWPGATIDTYLAAFTDRLRGGRNFFAPYLSLYAADLKGILVRLGESGIPTTLMTPLGDQASRSKEAQTAVLGIEPLCPEGGSWLSMEFPETICSAVRDLVAGGRT